MKFNFCSVGGGCDPLKIRHVVYRSLRWGLGGRKHIYIYTYGREMHLYEQDSIKSLKLTRGCLLLIALINEETAN